MHSRAVLNEDGVRPPQTSQEAAAHTDAKASDSKSAPQSPPVFDLTTGRKVANAPTVRDNTADAACENYTVDDVKKHDREQAHSSTNVSKRPVANDTTTTTTSASNDVEAQYEVNRGKTKRSMRSFAHNYSKFVTKKLPRFVAFKSKRGYIFYPEDDEWRVVDQDHDFMMRPEYVFQSPKEFCKEYGIEDFTEDIEDSFDRTQQREDEFDDEERNAKAALKAERLAAEQERLAAIREQREKEMEEDREFQERRRREKDWASYSDNDVIGFYEANKHRIEALAGASVAITKPPVRKLEREKLPLSQKMIKQFEAVNPQNLHLVTPQQPVICVESDIICHIVPLTAGFLINEHATVIIKDRIAKNPEEHVYIEYAGTKGFEIELSAFDAVQKVEDDLVWVAITLPAVPPLKTQKCAVAAGGQQIGLYSTATQRATKGTVAAVVGSDLKHNLSTTPGDCGALLITLGDDYKIVVFHNRDRGGIAITPRLLQFFRALPNVELAVKALHAPVPVKNESSSQLAVGYTFIPTAKLPNRRFEVARK